MGSWPLLVMYLSGIYRDASLLYFRHPHTFPHRHRRLQEEPAFVTTQTPDVLACLLPDATTLHLEACHVDTTAAQITLLVHSTQASVPCPCPLCTTPARRIHRHYERILADLPWAEYRVRLQLRVRKRFCRNLHCRRRIFTKSCQDAPLLAVGRNGILVRGF